MYFDVLIDHLFLFFCEVSIQIDPNKTIERLNLLM